MLNSPLLLVFESYSPALAESSYRQCVARKWATKAYCRHVTNYILQPVFRYGIRF